MQNIKLVENMDSAAIVQHVLDLMESRTNKAILDQGPAPKFEDIAVLGRNHFLLEKLSRIMTERGIPHTYIGKQSKLTNSEEFRRFHAFLKLIVNPYDNFSFLLIHDLIGLSAQDYADIRYQAAQKGSSHFQVWLQCGDQALKGKVIFRSGSLQNAITETEIFIRSELNICENSLSFDFVMAWLDDNPTGTLEQYLTWLATYDIQDEIKDDAEGVQLMTIHAAKGLEFPTVILAGCNEEILPSKQSIKNNEIEAERRLFYVAITRAENDLILTSRPERTEKNGQTYFSPKSRFISEAI